MQSLAIYILTVVVWLSRTAVAQADVAAAVVKKSPACSLPCIMNVITSGVCTIDEIAPCVCTNFTLQANLSICVQQSCDFDDQIRAASVETSLCSGYPQEIKPDGVKLASLVGAIVCLPVVALRIFTRVYLTGRLWIDDYLTLAATGALIGIFGIAFASTDLGLGQHYWNIDPDTGMVLLQRFYVVQILYILILTMSKIAIAVLLRRIFQTPRFQMVINYLCAFLVVKGTVFLLLDALQCMPVQSVWNPRISDRQCLDIGAIGIVGGAVSIADDVVLLLLPFPWLWKLQLKQRTRVGLFVIFSVGSFACLTSMIRMKYIATFARSYDPTWDNVEVILWSLIEELASVLCGSLPALWPLVNLISPQLLSRGTGSSKPSSRSKGSQPLPPKPPTPKRATGFFSILLARDQTPVPWCSGDGKYVLQQDPENPTPPSPWRDSHHEKADTELEHPDSGNPNTPTSARGSRLQTEDVELGLLKPVHIADVRSSVISSVSRSSTIPQPGTPRTSHIPPPTPKLHVPTNLTVREQK